jgi:hypothetical protein
MKKILYTFLLATVLSITFSSCTEEEIKPNDTELSNGGGTGGIDKV